MTRLEQIIANIAENKTPCVFISPHLDDAMFSAGGLISELSEKTDVTIVTIFTNCESSRPTLSMKKFLNINGYPNNQEDLFSVRRKEDIRACQSARIKFIHLGFTDALWRKKIKPGLISRILGSIFPEFIHLYPFYRFNIISGAPAKGDSITIGNVKESLLNLADKIGNAVIFCPIGVGNHVDHIIARNICTEIFANPIFWIDFPYNQNYMPDDNFISKMSLVPCSWNKNLQKKFNLILKYGTQKIDAEQIISGDSANNSEETFYIIKK
ncbi:MAG: hypothetical protein HW401_395 [Parcubacteria group bacterium]|nr:hypothetical protein [Parcubacteria group bacterium]